MKLNYKTTFNRSGEIHVFYHWAESKAKARILGLRKLSKKLGLLPFVLSGEFSGNKPNYKIEEV